MHRIKAIILLLCLTLCHSRKNGSENGEKIIGGRLAKQGEFPYVVSFSSPYICSGTLISLSQVMTSAQCFYDKQKTMITFWSRIKVIGGSLELSDLHRDPEDPNAQVRKMTSLVFAEGFKEENIGGFIHHDIAFAQVNRPFKESSTLRVAPLPGKTASAIECKWRKLAKAGTLKCFLVGWGTTKRLENGTINVLHSKYLKVAEVIAWSDCKCKDEVAKGRVDGTLHGEVCLAPAKEGEYTCEGDRGAPIICKGMVFGVVTTTQCFIEGDYTDHRKHLDKQYGVLLWNYIENADLYNKGNSFRLFNAFSFIIASIFFLI